MASRRDHYVGGRLGKIGSPHSLPQSEGGYKLFKIGDLFNVDETWIYGKNKQYNTREQKPKEGFSPVVSGITVNNGINYYTKDELLPEEIFTDSLTISTRGEYSGTVTYHDGEFGLANNILVMATPSAWSRNAKLYLGTLISKLGYGGYNGYPRKETLKKDSIYLPVTKNGEIDFEYIERYMHELEQERARRIDEYLETSGYKNYSLTYGEEQAVKKLSAGLVQSKIIKIIDFFKVSNSHNILKSDITFDSGTTPYVTACEGNNSIVSYINYRDDMKEAGDTIMIGGKTLVITYQPDAYFSNDSHNLVLSVKEKAGINENVQLFLVSALYKSLKPKYTWGDSISKAKIHNDTFVLPVTADGSIDYAFMENYINAIKKQTIARVKEYIDSEFKTEEPAVEPSITPLHIHDSYQPGRIPLYTLRAACGRFEDNEFPVADGWVDATGHGFTPDKDRYFAVHAKGDSMLPLIHDGDICVFEWYTGGSRKGEIVLMQLRDFDPEYDGRYTIKRYDSEKMVTEDYWEHKSITLSPRNPAFEPIIIHEDESVRTIGIFKCTLD